MNEYLIEMKRENADQNEPKTGIVSEKKMKYIGIMLAKSAYLRRLIAYLNVMI
jgi:hypothetical protein